MKLKTEQMLISGLNKQSLLILIFFQITLFNVAWSQSGTVKGTDKKEGRDSVNLSGISDSRLKEKLISLFDSCYGKSFRIGENDAVYIIKQYEQQITLIKDRREVQYLTYKDNYYGEKERVCDSLFFSSKYNSIRIPSTSLEKDIKRRNSLNISIRSNTGKTIYKLKYSCGEQKNTTLLNGRPLQGIPADLSTKIKFTAKGYCDNTVSLGEIDKTKTITLFEKDHIFFNKGKPKRNIIIGAGIGLFAIGTLATFMNGMNSEKYKTANAQYQKTRKRSDFLTAQSYYNNEKTWFITQYASLTLSAAFLIAPQFNRCKH